ncbi:MAG: hypothetical protein HOA72_23270 [Desulfobacula sp.]|jgi:hypothetical protein|uniref:hypothetical protein n=1 Tax=Desulfobacula sp. TaxID=2593537 RepID=UPI002A041E9E|nr:hypothetical protein [Desulfobacula sp.]
MKGSELLLRAFFLLAQNEKRRLRTKSGQNQEKELEANKKRKKKQGGSVTLF